MENYIEDLIGHVIDDYRLEAVLGSGGMGVVYKARHLSSSQEVVAIKILWPKDSLSPEDYENFLRRFWREAQVITKLDHPSIVRVYSYGELDETFTGYTPLPYIVMPYIPGKTLSEKLKHEGGTFPLRIALPYIEQAADALMHAHQAGVTHRDLKPGNFLLDEHYSDWAQKKYTSAYALLDQDYQKENSYASLAPYYQNTLRLCITIGTVTQLTASTIKVNVTDNAIEASPDGSGSAINLYQGYFLVKHQPTGWSITPNFQFVSAGGQCDDPL